MSKWRDHGNATTGQCVVGAAEAYREERNDALELLASAMSEPIDGVWKACVDELLDRCRNKATKTVAQHVREVNSTAGQLIAIATAIDDLRAEILKVAHGREAATRYR